MGIKPKRLIKSQLPLWLKLSALRLATYCEPQKPILLNWGRRHLNLRPESERAWYRRALWGIAAGEAVRLNLGKPAAKNASLSLIEENSWAGVDAVTRNGGAILAAAHIGPPKLAMHALAERKIPLMIWTATDGNTPHWAKNVGALIIDPRTQARRSEALLKSAIHLRKGGILFAAPDADSGSQLIQLDALNKTWSFSRGVPALARTIGVPTFLVVALWYKNRIKMRCAPIEPPNASCADEEWDRLWISNYWKSIEDIIRTSPENLRFLSLEEGLKVECGL